MALSQIQLEAFREVAKVNSFSKAAKYLGLTQSALSHRIKNLESSLEATLFLRQGKGIQLTEAGQELLQFCRVQNLAEEEFLRGRATHKAGLSGTLRVGGVSTLMRSVVLPSLSKLLQENSEVRLEFFVREAKDLPQLLSSGEADLLVTTSELPGMNLVEEFLGCEENVLIEPAKGRLQSEIFLDHDPQDQTTFAYLKLQSGKMPKVIRSYLDEIYGILDGVALGLGRAVVPLHLARKNSQVRVVEKQRSLKIPVRLYQAKQPYYTALQKAAAEAIRRNAAKHL